MALSDIGRARQQRCFRCENVRSCPNAALRARNEHIPGRRTKVHWCKLYQKDPQGVPRGQLTRQFLGQGTCPAGDWDGLEPITPEMSAEERLEKHAQAIIKQPFARRLNDQELEDAMVEIIEAGRLSAEVATRVIELKRADGLPRDIRTRRVSTPS